MSVGKPVTYETHGHCWIVGASGSFAHSHDGGDTPHEHTDGGKRTGPGSYTIDTNDWYARTGSRGRGGKKKFTKKPTGLQLTVVQVEAPKIRVFVVGDGGASVAGGASGAGELPLIRMMLACKSEIESVTHVSGGPRKAKAR